MLKYVIHLLQYEEIFGVSSVNMASDQEEHYKHFLLSLPISRHLNIHVGTEKCIITEATLKDPTSYVSTFVMLNQRFAEHPNPTAPAPFASQTGYLFQTLST